MRRGGVGDGYIKHFDGRLKDNTHVGWADVRTGDPVDDKNIFGKYEKAILEKVEQTIEELDWSKHNALKSMREGERKLWQHLRRAQPMAAFGIKA